jgi:hydroxysqualene dehydroxylase
MPAAIVHIVGAGLAGLSAAVKLVAEGTAVKLYDAASQAGGRCRSYHEPALDMTIDNGNHLVLSGNRETMKYAAMIGTRDRLIGPAQAEFAFVDLKSRAHWTLKLNSGRLPWWMFSPKCRVPGTTAMDYLGASRLLFPAKGASIGDTIRCSGLLYERLWKPLLLAALNTEPTESSAQLAAAVIWETLALGGAACRPLVAEQGLSRVFIDPAVRMIETCGAPVCFGFNLRRICFDHERVAALDFGEQEISLGAHDSVILAVPSWVAGRLIPNLQVPSLQRAIVNGHFRLDAPPKTPAMLGVIGGVVEWIFVFPDRIATTISGADRLIEQPRERLAMLFWEEVQAATGISSPLPPWQIIKEKRATFAALPSEDAKRPKPQTEWRNLVLAGDFTATGLPATIEGAIRSGFRAADLAFRQRDALPPRPRGRGFPREKLMRSLQ